jgi:fatty acid elongase 3
VLIEALTLSVFVYFASYTYFTSTYFQWMPNVGTCAGEEFAAFAGIGILSSYLVLFISFYFATYRKDGKPPTTRKSLRRMSQAPLPDPHDLAAVANGHAKSHANGHANGHAKTTGANKPNGVTTRSRKA